tara:strand:+ start:47930 stop:48238 length:309 start_codon:yes stop_codon:yes gene_type:complete
MKIDKNSFIKKTCSLLILGVKYRRFFFSKEKKSQIKVWYTKSKIHLIEIIGNIKEDYVKSTMSFELGDKITDVIDWAELNDHEILYILNKGQGKYKNYDNEL